MVAAWAVAKITNSNMTPTDFLTGSMNRILSRRAILSLVGRDSVEPGDDDVHGSTESRPTKTSWLELVCRPRFALRHFSCRQLPRSLSLERKREQLCHSQLVFIPKRGHPN